MEKNIAASKECEYIYISQGKLLTANVPAVLPNSYMNKGALFELVDYAPLEQNLILRATTDVDRYMTIEEYDKLLKNRKQLKSTLTNGTDSEDFRMALQKAGVSEDYLLVDMLPIEEIATCFDIRAVQQHYFCCVDFENRGLSNTIQPIADDIYFIVKDLSGVEYYVPLVVVDREITRSGLTGGSVIPHSSLSAVSLLRNLWTPGTSDHSIIKTCLALMGIANYEASYEFLAINALARLKKLQPKTPVKLNVSEDSRFAYDPSSLAYFMMYQLLDAKILTVPTIIRNGKLITVKYSPPTKDHPMYYIYSFLLSHGTILNEKERATVSSAYADYSLASKQPPSIVVPGANVSDKLEVCISIGYDFYGSNSTVAGLVEQSSRTWNEEWIQTYFSETMRLKKTKDRNPSLSIPLQALLFTMNKESDIDKRSEIYRLFYDVAHRFSQGVGDLYSNMKFWLLKIAPLVRMTPKLLLQLNVSSKLLMAKSERVKEKEEKKTEDAPQSVRDPSEGTVQEKIDRYNEWIERQQKRQLDTMTKITRSLESPPMVSVVQGDSEDQDLGGEYLDFLKKHF